MFDVKIALSSTEAGLVEEHKNSVGWMIRAQEALTERLINIALSRLYRRNSR